MSPEDWKKYIKNEKEKYKKLICVKCPAFGNEEVYFNNYGFDHIISKGRIPRPKEEVMDRFKLLPYAPNIIKNTKSVDNEERRTRGKSVAYFWTIKSDSNIRIILRRLNNGTIHFYSIMNE